MQWVASDFLSKDTSFGHRKYVSLFEKGQIIGMH